MKLEDFKSIMDFLDSSSLNSCKLLIKQTQEKFNNIISDDALVSIVLQWYIKKIKNSNHQKYTCSFFYDQYIKRLEKTKSEGHPTIIKDLSSEFELPPTTLARVILAHYISLQNNNENVKFVDEFNRLYKNPFLIKDVNLSAELRRTTADDVSYGPVIASIRNLVGLSYEEKLQRQVEKLNIPYRTEESMRGIGFDKTPDIKLQVPIMVDGKLVNWIESKAMFGSLDSHRQYWLSQYMCYRNRLNLHLTKFRFFHLFNRQVWTWTCHLLVWFCG